MIFTAEGPPLASGFQLPEGPRWHDGRLWFSDIRAGRVFTLTEDGALTLRAQFDEPCSGLGFLEDGTALVALMSSSRIARLGRADRAPDVHADLSALGGTHVNDMISDATGRCYVDCLSYQAEWAAPETLPDGARLIPFVIKPGSREITDRIALVDPDGRSRIVADGLLGPNGIAISSAGDRLVVAEWRAGRITSFDVEPGDGSLSGRGVLCAGLEGNVDGLCLDAAGAVWCAAPAAGECIRVDRAGEVIDVARPRTGNHVMACVLGGADRRTLFMMTNRRPNPTSGHVEAVRVAIAGDGRP